MSLWRINATNINNGMTICQCIEAENEIEANEKYIHQSAIPINIDSIELVQNNSHMSDLKKVIEHSNIEKCLINNQGVVSNSAIGVVETLNVISNSYRIAIYTVNILVFSVIGMAAGEYIWSGWGMLFIGFIMGVFGIWISSILSPMITVIIDWMKEILIILNKK